MDFNFEQNQTVEALDKVPADFQSFYVEKDGKFTVDDRFKNVAKSIDGLNKTNKTLRGNDKTARDSIAAWSALGESPEAVTAMISDLNEKLAKGEKINPEKIKEEVAKSYDGKIKEKDAKIEGLTGAVRKHLITSVATSAIAEAKGVPELLLPHIERQVKMVEDKGEFKVVVVDSDGETRYGSGGSPLTIAELVSSMKADKVYGRAFESETPGGGGANPKGTQNPTKQPVKAEDMSSIDRISAGLKKRNG